MLPATWVAALLFLLFVVPGLTYDLLSDRRRSLGAESTFREISRVMLASTAFTGITIVAIQAASQLLDPVWPVRPTKLLSDGGRYAATVATPLAWTVVAATGTATTLAVATHLIRANMSGGATIRQRSAWTRAFSHDCPPGKYPYVRVRLESGAQYSGRLQDYSSDLELEDRELVLTPPWLKVKPPEGDWQKVPSDVERIILRGALATSITVTYWPIDREDSTVREAASNDTESNDGQPKSEPKR